MKCFECKENFDKKDLISYAAPLSKTAHNYCSECLKKRQARDMFSMKVCEIFGIKTPGPRIWAERKRLINTYGYTDEIIVRCLDYLYKIENKKKISESLCIINPSSVDRMLNYEKRNQMQSLKLVRAIDNFHSKEYIVPIKEENKKDKEKINIEALLNEE